jgi:hypothetical protein
MAAGTTFSQIYTSTLTSNGGTFIFNNIPNTYTDLFVSFKIIPYNAGGAYMNLRLGSNNTIDANSNYKNQQFYLTSGGGAFDFSNTNTIELVGNQFQNLGSFQGNIRINGYTKSAYKTVMTNMFTSDNTSRNYYSSWASTDTLNSISLFSNVNAFGVGSTASLYGIAAA